MIYSNLKKVLIRQAYTFFVLTDKENVSCFGFKICHQRCIVVPFSNTDFAHSILQVAEYYSTPHIASESFEC